MASLRAKCMQCDNDEPRQYFKRRTGLDYPKFEDVCPACGSDDVDVYDPAHRVPDEDNLFDDIEGEDE